jgi:hypothetical protein
MRNGMPPVPMPFLGGSSSTFFLFLFLNPDLFIFLSLSLSLSLSHSLSPQLSSFQVYSHDPEGKEIVTFATGTDADRTATSSSDFKLGFKLVMQQDHDLVLLSDSGEVIWRTNTVGKGMGGETVYAALDDEGVLHGE